MDVLLIRHGEPAWSRDGRSVDDPDLTERGRLQAQRLGERLRGLEVDHVLVSPLRRAQQTAEPVVDALDIEPTTLDWLAEIAAPPFEGTPVEQVQRLFADSARRPLPEHWDGLPGGERFGDFHQRVTTGLRGLLTDLGARQVHDEPPLWDLRQPARRVVVVAHAGTNSVALGHLLGIPPVPWEWERFVSFHASVSTVRPVAISDAHSFSLFRFADTSHLPTDEQTY